jgi:SpoVK/Ycf46/Vps4 family AAA+-type ATPase
MNDNVSEVFVVATANNLSNLPPELKRKGRFDEIFFVDLPSESSRSNIFEIHLNLNEPSWREQEIDVHELARLTKQWTGAEIEACIQDSVFTAFSDGNREVTMNDLRESIRSITPQAQSMKEDIEAMRSAAAAIGQFAELRNDSSNNGGGNVYG